MGNRPAQEIADAAADLAAARARLVVAMSQARQSGMSYREISRHAGISHETVRTMLSGSIEP